MNIIINGNPINCTDECTITDVLQQLQLNPENVVIEKNKKIVPSTIFSTTTLNEQDTLELLHFVGGG